MSRPTMVEPKPHLRLSSQDANWQRIVVTTGMICDALDDGQPTGEILDRLYQVQAQLNTLCYVIDAGGTIPEVTVNEYLANALSLLAVAQ